VTDNVLARVKRAADLRRRADEEYRASLQAARDSGLSAGDIAKPAGVTRQAVLKLTSAPSPTYQWRVKAEARLAELDDRWEHLVDEIAEMERPPDAHIKRENAKRNGRRGKDARKGLRRRPSVLEEARAFAEAKLLRTLHQHRDDIGVQRVVAEIAEAAALRDSLERCYDRSLGIDR
jgi:hypothetical protein